MTSWVKDPESKRLVWSKPDPKLEPEPKLELKEMIQERPLSML